MCISRSCTEISLPSSSMQAHLPGYPLRLAKMWGHMLASSYCSRKASTSKHQSVYVTSAPGSVNLKIGISNLVGASHFLSQLPLWPLCLHQWPAVSLAVEYPSESVALLSGEEGGKPPPPTIVHWDFGGLPRGCAAPALVVSLASVTSSTPEALPTCCGALPTSWLEESDLATTTGILGTGFSARSLSLWWLEAATDHHHTSTRGRRLMVKWAESEIHSEKVSSTWVRTACAASCPKPQWPCLS